MRRNLIKLWSATCQTCCSLRAPALLGQFQEAFAGRLVYYIKVYALGEVWSRRWVGVSGKEEQEEDVTCLGEAGSSLDKRQQRINENT